MTPLEFLHEECENVTRALEEALRFDYAPKQRDEYYAECKGRLGRIKSSIVGLVESDLLKISLYLNELARLATWISLVERSHLGEFPWPFSDELRRIATTILKEKNLAGPLPPIVLVVAEGKIYRIICETPVPDISTDRRFFIISFPRSLKYHVLLHAIFAHEVGHAALQASDSAMILQNQVIPELVRKGPMANVAAASNWLNAASAPDEVKRILQEFQQKHKRSFQFGEAIYLYWLIELTSDLFGLLLFGPSFMAALRVLLEPINPVPASFDLADPTHPPFAVRHKMLVQALHILGWDNAVSPSADEEVRTAETKFFAYLKNESYPAWVQFFDDDQLRDAIGGIQSLLGPLAYQNTDAGLLVRLVKRLARVLPPIADNFDTNGDPKLTRTDFRHILHAGWVYWIGYPRGTSPVLTFYNTNRLCNQALTQQRAINDMVDARK
jgi:hypothetical protein